MKKNIFTFILFLVFVTNAYSVNLNYIPTDSSFVWSTKLDNITSKSKINTQEFLNLIFMEKLAISFDNARDDDQVSYAMTNSIASMLNFSKTSRLISYGDAYSLLVDIKDIRKFDLFMLKMARAEDFTIESIYEGKLRYLELDEENILAWDNDVFSIIVLSDEGNSENTSLLDIADEIFSREGNISEETFLALEKDKSWDSAFWIDYEEILSKNNMWEMMGINVDDYPIFKAKVEKEYKDATLTAKAFIDNYEIKIEAEAYTPNTTMDATTLIKKVDPYIYNLVPNSNMGFIAFSVDPKELGKMLFSFIKGTEVEAEMNTVLDEVGGTKFVTDLLNVLSGDFVISTTGIDNGEDFFIAMGINNKKNAIKFIKDLYESKFDGEKLAEIENNGFTVLDIDGIYFAFKDKIAYAVFDEESLSYIINNENNDPLPSEKSILINDNMFSIFLNIEALYPLLFGPSSDNKFKSVTMTSKVLSKTTSNGIITLTPKDKDILRTLLELIEDEF